MKFFMMIGIPNSGKSEMAKEIAKQENAIIIATDDLREELFNNVNNQANNDLVFRTAMQRVKQNIKNKNVILDATNINYKKRMSMLHELNYVKDLQKIAVFVATPYEDCLLRNSMRERKVPESVIKRMYYNIYIPQYYEGFNDIQIIHNEIKPIKWEDLLKKMDISQDNPHHTLTLKEHCMKVQEIIDSQSHHYYMKDVGLLHDIGKIEAKSFINSKGEKTDIAHYYNHEKVGAYISCLNIEGLWQLSTPDLIDRANLIQWHMLPYSNMSEKTINKYKKLLGERTWNDLMFLHESDKEAH